jgi:arylsulfatase
LKSSSPVRLWFPARITLAIGLIAGAAATGQTARTNRPLNVILIVADDLGVGELGCYGQTKIKTPALDRMAAEGMRFTRAYSGAPVCAPARCTLMTGKHLGHAWIRDNREAKPEGQEPLPEGEMTLPELFRGAGYRTAAFGKWGLGPVGSSGDPNRRGFDLFFGYNCQRHAHNHYPSWLRRNDQKVPLEGNHDRATGAVWSHDLFEAGALDEIRAAGKSTGQAAVKPLFLFLPVIVPHVAVQAPDDAIAEYRGQWNDPAYEGGKGYLPHPTPRAAYAAMVSRLDRTVGRIFEELRKQGLDDDTVVIFTSDNGATHGGVGGSDSEFFESMGKLRGLKGSVYEGGIRTPLLVRWPKRIAAGGTSDLRCYFPDLLPTLLDLAGQGARIPAGLDGVSLAPTLLGKPADQKVHDHLFWDFPGYGGQQALIRGDWKAVRQNLNRIPGGNQAAKKPGKKNAKKAAPTGPGVVRTELYDLKNDPNETTDVAAKHPEIVAEMERLMKAARTPSTLFPQRLLDAPGS